MLPIGCKKSDSARQRKIGSFSQDQRVILGTLDGNHAATFMAEDFVIIAFSAAFPHAGLRPDIDLKDSKKKTGFIQAGFFVC
ncbi:MAG: hypothetical protein EA392_13345 [Cryomorphaceae bacterium]|nr:MAG: hypothetical protein EA392_13345 [Cryomorphaceae bacterium]